MLRCVLALIAVANVALYSSLSRATADFDAAGVLLAAHEGGAAYILLGRDRFRPWFEMPGGSREQSRSDGEATASRPETAYETALREFFEESRGFFKPDFLRSVTDSSQFIRDGSFVFFRAVTDKVSAGQILNAPIPDHVDPAPFGELVDFAWVSVEAIQESNGVYVVDDSGRRIQVRRQLKPRVLKARAAGWL